MKNLFLGLFFTVGLSFMSAGHIALDSSFEIVNTSELTNCCSDSAVDRINGIRYTVTVCDINGEPSAPGHIENCLHAAAELKVWIDEIYGTN